MGLFSRRKGAFGLDVGSSAVKVVQLNHGSKGYTLDAFAMVDLPPDAIGEGVIKDPPVVVDAIKEAVRKAGVKAKEANISVSGRELIMKKIQLPKVNPKELGDALLLEAEHHINLPIEEVYLDHQIVGQSAGQTGTMDVMLVAVKRSKINEYVAVVEAAGLFPAVVDVDAFAIQNQYEINNPVAAETVALIDIGASVMKANVIRSGSSIFARDIAFGGNNYTRAISQRLNIPFSKAESAKRGQDVSGVRWDDLVPSLEAVSRELSLEIQRTFDYFASTTESERISRIVLSGGCAKLAGVDQFLSSSWGIPVEIGKPFQNVQFNPSRFPADDLYAAGPLLAVAVGLGIRRERDKPA